MGTVYMVINYMIDYKFHLKYEKNVRQVRTIEPSYYSVTVFDNVSCGFHYGILLFLLLLW